jgi:hypothetical protein
VAKHLNDETAEFALPGAGRHAGPDTGELEVTQRFDAGLQRPRPVPTPQPGRATDAR